VKRESLLAQASPTCIVAYHCCTLAKTSRSSRPVSHLASHLHLHLILAIAPTPAIAPSRFLLPRLVRFLALTRTLSIARLLPPPPHSSLDHHPPTFTPTLARDARPPTVPGSHLHIYTHTRAASWWKTSTHTVYGTAAHERRETDENDRYVGLMLAVSSSLAIGASFVITKKGLNASIEKHGFDGDGFGYLQNPVWWAGITTSERAHGRERQSVVANTVQWYSARYSTSLPMHSPQPFS